MQEWEEQDLSCADWRKSIKEGCINCEDERVKHAKLNMVLKRLFARFANQQAIVEV